MLAMEITSPQSLRAIREKNGLKQVDIAERMGISSARVGILENQRNLRMDTLTRYLEAVGYRLVILALEKDEENA